MINYWLITEEQEEFAEQHTSKTPLEIPYELLISEIVTLISVDNVILICTSVFALAFFAACCKAF